MLCCTRLPSFSPQQQRTASVPVVEMHHIGTVKQQPDYGRQPKEGVPEDMGSGSRGGGPYLQLPVKAPRPPES